MLPPRWVKGVGFVDLVSGEAMWTECDGCGMVVHWSLPVCGAERCAKRYVPSRLLRALAESAERGSPIRFPLAPEAPRACGTLRACGGYGL